MHVNLPIVVTPVNTLEFPSLREVWAYKGLLFYLVLRDLKVRFQQTLIGVLWIVLQPLIQLLIFYTIFGILVKIPTGDVPYSVFFMSGFVFWQLFTQIVNSCSLSLLGNLGVITKTYFPRLTLPLSTTVGAFIDFVISFLVLLIFLLANHYAITARYLILPILVVLTMVFALGVGLLFGALMVVFRDTKNLLGFILQIWMYASPIMYPITIAPEQFRRLAYINPMTGFIEAGRWIFLGSDSFPPLSNLAISAVAAVILLILGMYAFRSMENRIADVM